MNRSFTCTAYQYVPSYFRASTNGGLCIKIALSPKINFIIFFFKSLELKLKLGTKTLADMKSTVEKKYFVQIFVSLRNYELHLGGLKEVILQENTEETST